MNIPTRGASETLLPVIGSIGPQPRSALRATFQINFADFCRGFPKIILKTPSLQFEVSTTFVVPY